jgi:hypothetical protein
VVYIRWITCKDCKRLKFFIFNPFLEKTWPGTWLEHELEKMILILFDSN